MMRTSLHKFKVFVPEPTCAREGGYPGQTREHLGTPLSQPYYRAAIVATSVRLAKTCSHLLCKAPIVSARGGFGSGHKPDHGQGTRLGV